ncbi:ankyrin repeat domain-containing protein [Aspergillus mulundensis]|uniref:Uncharacterized protein n=1 Tax=Aspergillus mulundensis TaxID=1810919 RepID=A0A3D8R4N1_9EURO|nr:hypothetical protein DSM5745_08773 [Aspergillus mulundensis]RDW69013.1 hypothetical protein DSM5745_08773 [Aspergillus mulundensis]
MATFPLFDLPPELVLCVLEASEARDLAVFIRTSRDAWNIGHPVLYSGPIEWKQKAFIWAAEHDRPQLLEYIIEDILPVLKENDTFRKSAFLAAARGGCCSLVDLLIENGVEPSDGLMGAIKADKPEVVKILLPHGIPDGSEGRRVHLAKETFLAFASAEGSAEVIKFLVTIGANVDGTERHNPLMHAVEAGHHKAAEVLLTSGADIKLAQGSLGRTALRAAAGNGDNQMVRLLLTHGANVNQKDLLDMTPLCYATQHLETCKTLLDAGASVEADRNMPLVEATIRDYRDVVDLLLARRPKDIERTDLLGRTPLAVAAHHNRPEILQKLIQLGADVNKADRTGQTPLSHAVENESTECIAILRNAGCRESDSDGTIPAEIINLFNSLAAGLRRS